MEAVEPENVWNDFDLLVERAGVGVAVEDLAKESSDLESFGIRVIETGDRPPFGELIDDIEREGEQKQPAMHEGRAGVDGVGRGGGRGL